MTRVELGCFCLLLVDKSLNDCANFKGISLLHYAQNHEGFDYGHHLHFHGSYSVIKFTSDGVDADVEYFMYDKHEFESAINHFLDSVAGLNISDVSDNQLVENYVKSWLHEVCHENQRL